MRFVLEIKLGSEAMQTNEDINAALVKVGERGVDPDGGTIRDDNGNTVGNYRMEPDADADAE